MRRSLLKEAFGSEFQRVGAESPVPPGSVLGPEGRGQEVSTCC